MCFQKISLLPTNCIGLCGQCMGLFPNRVDNPVFLEAKFRTV